MVRRPQRLRQGDFSVVGDVGLWVPNPIGCGFGGHIRRDEVLIVGSGEDADGIEVVAVDLCPL